MTTPVIVDNLFLSVSIDASGNSTSDIDLRRMNAEGFFSIQYQITGDGTVTIDYLESNDGSNFVDPEDDIDTGFTKTGGPNSDGIDLQPFEPNLCGVLRIRITETGGVNGVVASAWVAVQ